MEVILLERIRNLGVLGDTVKVKSGFARNFLVPQGKAVYATPANIKAFEARRAELEKKAAEKHAKAVARQEKINALPVITLKAKASDEGKLFGSISVREIADAIIAAGTEVEKREIVLADVIRTIGEFDVSIELENDIVANVKLVVEAE